jgi:hypothetical protein
VISASIFVMVLFVVTALERMRYPYELEQLEGSMFLSALRVFHGQALYPRPSLAFIPYMYPPVYYYVCAAAGHVMGMSIATLRAVSSLSTLGCFVVILCSCPQGGSATPSGHRCSGPLCRLLYPL